MMSLLADTGDRVAEVAVVMNDLVFTSALVKMPAVMRCTDLWHYRKVLLFLRCTKSISSAIAILCEVPAWLGSRHKSPTHYGKAASDMWASSCFNLFLILWPCR